MPETLTSKCPKTLYALGHQNFAEYVSLYPEFKHVFVGDNGQGDVKAAEMMVERYPGSLEAVYMHRVRWEGGDRDRVCICLLYTSPSPRDKRQSRMPSSA